MTESPSPIAITFPRMHSAYKTRKQANSVCKSLGDRAVSNNYWVESVKLESGDEKEWVIIPRCRAN